MTLLAELITLAESYFCVSKRLAAVNFAAYFFFLIRKTEQSKIESTPRDKFGSRNLKGFESGIEIVASLLSYLLVYCIGEARLFEDHLLFDYLKVIIVCEMKCR